MSDSHGGGGDSSNAASARLVADVARLRARSAALVTELAALRAKIAELEGQVTKHQPARQYRRSDS